MRRILFSLAVCLLIGLPAVGQNVLTGTTTAMSFSPNPVVYPGSTTVTITVAPSTGAVAPTGSVSIKTGSTVLVTLNLNSSGVASAPLPTTGYPAGTYPLVAVYAGNSGFATSSSSTVDVTLKSPVTVAFQVIPNPITLGQKAELEAVLNATDGGGAPTGTVTFYVGTTALGSAPVSNGSAVLKAPTTGEPTGTYPIHAKYNGDTLHAAGNLDLGPFSFGSTGISTANNFVGIASGQNIYVLTENGSANPILILSAE